MEFPVYKRIPFPNYTLDKETFGTKIALASGEEKDGLCYCEDRHLSPHLQITWCDNGTMKW